MTPEGLAFILRLKMFSNKIREIEYVPESPETTILKVVLIQNKLTDEELMEAKFHIEHFCPEIVMYIDKDGPARSNGLNHNCIFIDEAMNMDASDHSTDSLKYMMAGRGSSKPWTLAHNVLNNSFDDLSEKRLREKLKEEEANENYEMCQEILKYAKSKGINL